MGKIQGWTKKSKYSWETDEVIESNMFSTGKRKILIEKGILTKYIVTHYTNKGEVVWSSGAYSFAEAKKIAIGFMKSFTY